MAKTSEMQADFDELDDEDLSQSHDGKQGLKFTGERMLVVIGFVLAIGAASFPWYVFFNQGRFGIKPMPKYAKIREMPDNPGHTLVTISPLAIPVRKNDGEPKSLFDPITTATIPEKEPKQNPVIEKLLDNPPSQDFPGGPKVHLLHVVNGRALIEDKSGVYLIREGSVLPDNSKVAKLAKQNGQWVIITSTGAVIKSSTSGLQ